MFQVFSKISLPILVSLQMLAPLTAARADVTVSWNSLGITKQIDTWSAAASTSKTQTLHEKDPLTGKVVSWEGVMLSSIVDEALKKLPDEQLKARVDLLVFKGAGSSTSVVPRMLATRWPLLLAWKRDGKALAQPTVVIPWTSKPQIMSVNEGVPLERFFVSGLTQVEFANKAERYGSLFLKRRTDPSAVRGEKLFVQNCMSCHSMGEGPAFTHMEGGAASRKLASDTHPNVRGMKSMGDRDRRALKSYLEAYASENPAVAAPTAVSAKR